MLDQQINTIKLDDKIEVLKLSKRAYKPLLKAKISTVRELVQQTERNIYVLRDFGVISLKEVKSKLLAHNLTLDMTKEEIHKYDSLHM